MSMLKADIIKTKLTENFYFKKNYIIYIINTFSNSCSVHYSALHASHKLYLGRNWYSHLKSTTKNLGKTSKLKKNS